MRADLTKVRQSLFNLLSNATKFTHDGTITLAAQRVRVGDADRVRLSVTDTGIGIPPDKLEAVFEEFSQADDSTTRDFGGTGLGLPISRRFCRIMAGDVTVTSRLGEGSTFTIDLPAQVDALEAAKQNAAKRVQNVEAMRPEITKVASASGPILVIDDEPEARELLRRALESDGYEVRVAEGGEAGLRLAREIDPAVITLDVMMPGVDGWEVLRRLKGDPKLKHIPVVMVSILHEKGLGFSLGASEYVTKPVDRQLLLHLVGQHVTKTGRGGVLVVEDDAATRELVRRTLEHEGWIVEEAENGAVGLERVSSRMPDLIVLDLMMPVMDGFEFLHNLRRTDDGRAVPVLVLTAQELDEQERQLLESKAQIVIQKDADALDVALEGVRAAITSHTQDGD